MDRVLPSEGRGCWFDPNRARQFDTCLARPDAGRKEPIAGCCQLWALCFSDAVKAGLIGLSAFVGTHFRRALPCRCLRAAASPAVPWASWTAPLHVRAAGTSSQIASWQMTWTSPRSRLRAQGEPDGRAVPPDPETGATESAPKESAAEDFVSSTTFQGITWHGYTTSPRTLLLGNPARPGWSPWPSSSEALFSLPPPSKRAMVARATPTALEVRGAPSGAWALA